MPEKYSADIYVMFPCFVDDFKAAQLELSESDNGAMLKAYLDKASLYEFGAGWEKMFNRKTLGDVTLIIKHEDRDDDDPSQRLGKQRASLVYVSGANQFLGLLYISVVNVNEHITFILDQCSRGEVAVELNGQERDFREYCKARFGLRVGDKAYSTVCPSMPLCLST